MKLFFLRYLFLIGTTSIVSYYVYTCVEYAILGNLAASSLALAIAFIFLIHHVTERMRFRKELIEINEQFEMLRSAHMMAFDARNEANTVSFERMVMERQVKELKIETRRLKNALKEYRVQ